MVTGAQTSLATDRAIGGESGNARDYGFAA